MTQVDINATRENILTRLNAPRCQSWIKKDAVLNDGWILSIAPDRQDCASLYLEMDVLGVAEVQCEKGRFETSMRWDRHSIIEFADAVFKGHVEELSVCTIRGLQIMTSTRVACPDGVCQSNVFSFPYALIPLPFFMRGLHFERKTFVPYSQG